MHHIIHEVKPAICNGHLPYQLFPKDFFQFYTFPFECIAQFLREINTSSRIKPFAAKIPQRSPRILEIMTPFELLIFI